MLSPTCHCLLQWRICNILSALLIGCTILSLTTRVIAPLQDKLNAERSRIGKRNRNVFNMATAWSSEERAAYDAVVALVANTSLMTFRDVCAERLLFTDASATGYGIVDTQVRDWDSSLPVDQQHHEPVVCKGSTFKHSELKWSVVEKEAFPIVKACQNPEYLLLRPKDFAYSATMPTWRTLFPQMLN